MALDSETIVASNTTSFQEEATKTYAIVTLLVENESGASVDITCKINGVAFVKNYNIPDQNTFVWDKKLLLSTGSTISIEANGFVNIVICGMAL